MCLFLKDRLELYVVNNVNRFCARFELFTIAKIRDKFSLILKMGIRKLCKFLIMKQNDVRYCGYLATIAAPQITSS